MDSTMHDIIIIIMSGVLTLFVGVIGFFLKKLYSSFEVMNKSIDMLNLGMNTIQSDLNNNTREVGELKAYLTNLEKDITRRMDKQFDMVLENRDNLIKVQSAQENCPARNNLK